jgi:hypothetical protein
MRRGVMGKGKSPRRGTAHNQYEFHALCDNPQMAGDAPTPLPLRPSAVGWRDPRPPAATVEAVGGRRGLVIIAVSTLVFAAGAAVVASGSERTYRARAYVIQVPAALGPERGVELARSENVLREAISLSRVGGLAVDELRRRSTAESTSRLDIALTAEADHADQAVTLATAYAKAFRRAIPDDEGLPTRGVGARRAQAELGPAGWGLIGAVGGLGVGVGLALLYDGVRRRPAPVHPPASAPRPRY